MCQSRCSKCDISYEHLYLALSFMVEALMNGTYPKNNDFDGDYKDGCDSRTNTKRNLNAIPKFEFLIGLVSLHQLL